MRSILLFDIYSAYSAPTTATTTTVPSSAVLSTVVRVSRLYVPFFQTRHMLYYNNMIPYITQSENDILSDMSNMVYVAKGDIPSNTGSVEN